MADSSTPPSPDTELPEMTAPDSVIYCTAAGSDRIGLYARGRYMDNAEYAMVDRAVEPGQLEVAQ